MKQKAKIISILVALFVAGLAVYQNFGLFTLRKALKLDLFFFSMQTREIPNAVFLLAAFLAGFLIAYFFNLSKQLKARRTNRQLNITLESKDETIKALRREVEALKAAAGSSEGSQTRSPSAE